MKLTIFILFSVIVVMIREIYIMAADEKRMVEVKKEFTKVITGCKAAKDILTKRLKRKKPVATEPVTQAVQEESLGRT